MICCRAIRLRHPLNLREGKTAQPVGIVIRQAQGEQALSPVVATFGVLMWPYTAYAIVFMSLTTVLSALITLWVWQRRHNSQAVYLILSTLSVTLWSAGYLIELTQRDVTGLSFWNRVQYLFIQMTLFTWTAFVVQYTGHGQWLTPRRMIAAAVIPAMTVLLAWTNDWHGLVWREITLNTAGAVPNTLAVRGPWYWVTVIYSYLLILLATWLLIRTLIRSPELYRRQAGTLLIGVLAPWVANILHIADLEPIPGLELTTFAFTLTNLTFAWNLFRNRLLDIMPVARALVVERMRDAVIVLDRQRRIVDLNPAAQRLLGKTDSESIGEPIEILVSDWPEFLAYCCLSDHAQAEIERGTGQARQVFNMNLYPLSGRRGQSNGALIVLHDITEQARAAEQREQLIRELDAFAHTVAHDLKNPLTSLIAYSDLLASRYERLDSEQVKRYLATIVQTGFKMNNIIDELLLLASVRNQAEVKITPLDMQQIVGNARRRLRMLIENAQAEIIEPETWPVALGHAGWVEEVWANYLSNAIKYGGQPPRIWMGATQQGQHIRFWVRDNGAGIAPEKHSQLFAMFARLDQIKAEGHGLGLSIVQRIVTRLGGEVGVESQEGEGSTFWFTLPAAA